MSLQYFKYAILTQSRNCLFRFYVAFKHLRSYRDGAACSNGTLTNALPHRNATPQTQDITPVPSQYTDTGLPVAVLSIDVERHTGIHSYPF